MQLDPLECKLAHYKPELNNFHQILVWLLHKFRKNEPRVSFYFLMLAKDPYSIMKQTRNSLYLPITLFFNRTSVFLFPFCTCNWRFDCGGIWKWLCTKWKLKVTDGLWFHKMIGQDVVELESDIYIENLIKCISWVKISDFLKLTLWLSQLNFQ